MKTSQYIGVRAERSQFRADIQIKGKKKFLGYYPNEVLAAQAYDSAIIMYGLDRKFNFPKAKAAQAYAITPEPKINKI